MLQKHFLTRNKGSVVRELPEERWFGLNNAFFEWTLVCWRSIVFPVGVEQRWFRHSFPSENQLREILHSDSQQWCLDRSAPVLLDGVWTGPDGSLSAPLQCLRFSPFEPTATVQLLVTMISLSRTCCACRILYPNYTCGFNQSCMFKKKKQKWSPSVIGNFSSNRLSVLVGPKVSWMWTISSLISIIDSIRCTTHSLNVIWFLLLLISAESLHHHLYLPVLYHFNNLPSQCVLWRWNMC